MQEDAEQTERMGDEAGPSDGAMEMGILGNDEAGQEGSVHLAGEKRARQALRSRLHCSAKVRHFLTMHVGGSRARGGTSGLLHGGGRGAIGPWNSRSERLPWL